MKKTLLILLSAFCVHLQASHFQNTITVTEQSNDQYLVEMKIENVAAEEPQVVAFPSLLCVVNEPTEVTIGTEESGYVITALISQTEHEKKLQTAIKIRHNGQIVDTSEYITKLVK